jgi:Uma2 family endonuclease
LVAGEPKDVVTSRHYTDLVALSPTAYRFTVKDYHRMVEAEIFKPKERVELIDGEVVQMSPIGSPHGACVDRLTQRFILGLGERAIVRTQGPIQVGEFSQPQPDVALLRARSNFYADQHPMPPDVLLVVEVADTSLRYDLQRKAPLYIAGGVPEVWVVDLVAEVIHVATPAGSRTVGAGESLAPAAFPNVVLEVAGILGRVG